MLIQHHKASEFSERAIGQFEQIYKDANDSARVLAILVHPYIMGAPMRSASKAYGGTTMSKLLVIMLALVLVPISAPIPAFAQGACKFHCKNVCQKTGGNNRNACVQKCMSRCFTK